MAVANVMAELSPEEVESNKEQQSMESEMLLNIYSAGEMTILKQGQEYTIKIVPQLRQEITLSLPTASRGAETNLTACSEDTNTSKSVENVKVSHLAGMSLYVKYPPTYPSHCPPECHVSAPWMQGSVAVAILDRLRAMFERESLVVYDWVTYLQDDMMEDCVRLCEARPGPGDDEINKQPSAPPASTSPPLMASPFQIFVRSTSQVHDMMEFDKFECFQEFKSGEHMCGICCDSVKGVLMCQPCTQCGLLYCRQCLLDYCKSCIGNSRMVELECPDNECHAVLPDVYLKEILPKEFLCRYIMLREKVELDSLPGMVFCPRCKQRTMSDPDSPVAVCENPSCGFPFCKTCRQTWHGPGMCPNLEKVSQMEAASDGEEEGEKQPESEESKQRRVEELKNLLWMLSSDSVRPCPSCKATIQKSGGCNKMTCNKCGGMFCWLCGKCILGYSHFDEQGSRCALFRNQDYLPTEEKDLEGFNDMDDLKETIDDLEHAVENKCPRCGMIVVKSSDSNWMHCRWCGFQHCHQCGEPCYGDYHFNEEYGCKRRTTLEEDAKRRQQLKENKEE